MNQEKIGKFIAECRKKKNMTQQELAEKLGVSDRTVGNWENGRNMPDLSLFKPLCTELDVSINELLKGYDPNFKNLNAVFIGGGSLLKGLKKYVEPKIPCEKIICVTPKTLGARNPSFFNCLGVLKAHDKYQGGFDDFHPKISQISRNL